MFTLKNYLLLAILFALMVSADGTPSSGSSKTENSGSSSEASKTADAEVDSHKKAIADLKKTHESHMRNAKILGGVGLVVLAGTSALAAYEGIKANKLEAKLKEVPLGAMPTQPGAPGASQEINLGAAQSVSVPPSVPIASPTSVTSSPEHSTAASVAPTASSSQPKLEPVSISNTSPAAPAAPIPAQSAGPF